VFQSISFHLPVCQLQSLCWCYWQGRARLRGGFVFRFANGGHDVEHLLSCCIKIEVAGQAGQKPKQQEEGKKRSSSWWLRSSSWWLKNRSGTSWLKRRIGHDKAKRKPSLSHAIAASGPASEWRNTKIPKNPKACKAEVKKLLGSPTMHHAEIHFVLTAPSPF